MVLLVAFFFYRLIKNVEHKIKRKNLGSVSSRNIDEIRNFISFSTRKGYSFTEIRKQLAKQGYNGAEISVAFGR